MNVEETSEFLALSIPGIDFGDSSTLTTNIDPTTFQKEVAALSFYKFHRINCKNPPRCSIEPSNRKLK